MEPAAQANPHFFFRPPLVRAAAYGGTFDGSLSPEVLVYLGAKPPCPDGVTGVDCPTLVARYGSEGRGANGVRVDASEEHYIANWKPAESLDRSATYRIIVRERGQTLDFLDVSNIKGGTIPIAFRIEHGALDVARAPIGTAGGTIETADGGVALTIPAGALPGATTITVAALELAPGQDNRVIGGTSYEFGPDGTQFSVPVTIRLSYDPANIPDGTSARLLRLHTLVNGSWILVPGSVVDTDDYTVVGQTTHFSTYALLPTSFVSVASGEFHACGLTAAGSAWCWGRNSSSQLGAPTTEICPASDLSSVPVACSTVAVEVAGGHVFQSVEAGNTHTCGVTQAGDIYCWGGNPFGQLGNGNLVTQPVPVLVETPHTFRAVSAEYGQTCALSTAGEVFCWGRNNQLQLGSPSPQTCGTQPCSTVPLRVSIPAASHIDVGLVHACARTTVGDIYCWGWNALGQIGTGSTSAPVSPTHVNGGPWASVSAGAMHTCGIKDTGAAYCWGSSFNMGTIGNGTKSASFTPAAVAGNLSFAQIDATNGNYVFTHSCGVTTAGIAYCWGANRDGALGLSGLAPETCTWGNFPSFDCSSVPIAVTTSLTFGYVTAGLGFTCGYATTGEAYCWGRNDNGQHGNGSLTGSRTPVRVQTAP
ncbi:MAG: hypothetical protein NUW01_07210 [Gemmatimonadaceae bacterium]|nr:hypothetical protein [Gemmatimonadaceae bacterium]